MGNRVIRLDYEDPTIFAKCGGFCSKLGPGSRINNLFYKAFTKRRWDRNPVCDNCKKPMVKLYEVKRPA
jgi:hypothetical protein